MRRVKEVLRLRFELGFGQREIARACSISQGAVHNYLKKAAAAGMQWPLPEGTRSGLKKSYLESLRKKSPSSVPFLIFQPSTISSSNIPI